MSNLRMIQMSNLSSPQRRVVLREADEEIRNLERLAATGDVNAQERLRVARRRRRLLIQHSSDRVRELRSHPRFVVGASHYNFYTEYASREIMDFATFRARAIAPAYPTPEGMWGGHVIDIICSRVLNPRVLSNVNAGGVDGISIGELIFDDGGVFYNFYLEHWVPAEWGDLLQALRDQQFDDHLGEWEKFFNLVVNSDACGRAGLWTPVPL